MRYAFAALVFAALTAAPAMAQQNQEQPRTPDDGVGVDYTQPFMNDLLLRIQPLKDGTLIYDRLQPCEKELLEYQRNRRVELLEAFRACVDREREKLEHYGATPAPGGRSPFYVPEPGSAPLVRPLPLAPEHPNAQE
jgi:hypothetical protein